MPPGIALFIGVPSVYLAGIAQRTWRIRIGYGVAVLPLHHPLRLAEEISWVDHLSAGRVVVGLGPGFSPFEFGGFGIPVNERHARSLENFEVLRQAHAEVQKPLLWHREMGLQVHERGEPITSTPLPASESIQPGSGDLFGSVDTVSRRLQELRALGLRRVIGWFHFGNMPHERVRRSMDLIASEVLPMIFN